MEGTGTPPTFDARWRRVLARLVAYKRTPLRARQLAAKVLRRSLPLRDLEFDTIVELAGRGSEGLALVGGPPLPAQPAEVLKIVDSVALIGPAVIYLRARTIDDEARSTALYSTIVLDKATANPHQLLASLVVVWHVASRLRLEHQRGILDRCVTLAAQPVDPYNPQQITFGARAAAAALLHVTTTLDDRFIERVRERGPSSPDLLTILATALQRRTRDRGLAMTRALNAAGADIEDARAFAAAADTRSSPADPVRFQGERRFVSTTKSAAGRLRALGAERIPFVAALLAGPAVFGSVWLASCVLPRPPEPSIGGGEAFGALAVLVAVHVVAAELAADRLRGILARHTSTPWALLAGESMAVALLAVTVVGVPHDEEAQKWIALTLVGTLVVALLLTLVRLVDRTDPVAAVKAFRRARRNSALRAGRQLGEIHRGAADAAEAVAALGWVRTVLTEPRVLRRESFVSERRGFFIVSAERLRRLGGKDRWRNEEVRLLVADQIGGAVSPGRELMSIVPSEATRVLDRDADEVRRCYQVRRLEELDALTEAAGALTGLIVDLGNEGNEAGATEVAEEVADLILAHQRAARQEAGDLGDRMATSPALITVADQAVRELRRGSDGPAREALLHLLQRILAQTTVNERFAAVILARAEATFRDAASDVTPLGLIWDAGQHAIDVGDDVGLFAAREAVQRQISVGANAVRAYEGAARLVQYAAFARYERALRLYAWFRTLHAGEQVRKRSILRVGASALLAGHLSLALEAAFDMRGVDMDALVDDYLEKREIVDAEQLQSDIYHSLLSADAQKSLQDFGRFARDVQRSVGPP